MKISDKEALRLADRARHNLREILKFSHHGRVHEYVAAVLCDLHGVRESIVRRRASKTAGRGRAKR